MFVIKFGIVHEGCLVNELSRAFPKIKFICPGGFILGPSRVEELLAVDRPSDAEVQAIIHHFQNVPGVDQVQLLERTADKAFIYFKASRVPKRFCSQAVEKNRCFKIGLETQHQGLERWTVGCSERKDAEQLLKDLAELGTLVDNSISETSWQMLLEGVRIS
jgi:hypothetical protein